jgi:hypothetical protein
MSPAHDGILTDITNTMLRAADIFIGLFQIVRTFGTQVRHLQHITAGNRTVKAKTSQIH